MAFSAKSQHETRFAARHEKRFALLKAALYMSATAETLRDMKSAAPLHSSGDLAIPSLGHAPQTIAFSP